MPKSPKKAKTKKFTPPKKTKVTKKSPKKTKVTKKPKEKKSSPKINNKESVKFEKPPSGWCYVWPKPLRNWYPENHSPFIRFVDSGHVYLNDPQECKGLPAFMFRIGQVEHYSKIIPIKLPKYEEV